MAELTPKRLRPRCSHHRRRPHKITQCIGTTNFSFATKISVIYYCLATNQKQYYKFPNAYLSNRLYTVTHCSPRKSSLGNKRPLLRHDARLTVFLLHGNPALNAILLQTTSTQSQTVHGLTSLNRLPLSRNEPWKTPTLARLAKLLEIAAICSQNQGLKFINFQPTQTNLFTSTHTVASDRTKCINIASRYFRQRAGSKLAQYKKVRLSPLKISRSRDTEEATSSLPASWVALVYVFHSVHSVYIYYVPATRSQQQRLPGGLTLTSSGQPTFGPGFIPWGTDWSITVLPASATLRRIHPYATSGHPDKSLLIIFILGTLFLYKVLYAITCLFPIKISLLTSMLNFHGPALSRPPVSYALTAIFARPELYFLAPTKSKHTPRHQQAARVRSLSKQTTSQPSLLYKQVFLLFSNQFSFYHAMTTPTPGTAVTLSSSDDSSSTSSSDSDTEDDNEQNRPCLLYTSPSPRDRQKSRMPSSA